MATLTVEKAREQIKSEKQNKVVMGKEPEQQMKDEQWEFIRDEVEKMKEAREFAQKEQQELKEEQVKLENKKLNLKLKRNKSFKNSEKDTRFNIMSQKGT